MFLSLKLKTFTRVSWLGATIQPVIFPVRNYLKSFLGIWERHVYWFHPQKWTHQWYKPSKKFEKSCSDSEDHESWSKRSKGIKESFKNFSIKSITKPVIKVPKQTDAKMYHFLLETVNPFRVLSSGQGCNQEKKYCFVKKSFIITFNFDV